jgi:uncharacterized protein with ATP-grasp and redox domains
MPAVEKKVIALSGIPPACHDCVIRQARSTARMADLDEVQTGRVVDVAKAGLSASKTQRLLVQHVVRQVADAVIAQIGAPPFFDLYAAVKEYSNTLALACARTFQAAVDAGEMSLETGLKLAAAGNIIDFGARDQDAIDLEADLRSMDETAFERFDIGAFKDTLSKASTLLYICDNSGEIVFDRLFVGVLRQAYPDLRIVAAVRHRPIINDATLADARAVGLDNETEVISSGSVYPGTILSETTAAFQRVFTAADVILAKGQGNFETLLPLDDERIFFLLRIKCDYMAGLAGVCKESLVLMQGGGRKRAVTGS